MAQSKGSPLPADTKEKMQGLFGADFSSVRVHTNSALPPAGAEAHTVGNDIFIKSGKYDPHTSDGRRLLGHELTHVVQQAKGQVKVKPGGNGLNINDDPALEREADMMGKNED